MQLHDFAGAGRLGDGIAACSHVLDVQLDRFADQIASSVERDGFFVRVPAGKQFYVYCTEAIDLTKAVVAADDERRARGDADFAKLQREMVRRALPANSADLINPLLPAFESLLNKKK